MEDRGEKRKSVEMEVRSSAASSKPQLTQTQALSEEKMQTGAASGIRKVSFVPVPLEADTVNELYHLGTGYGWHSQYLMPQRQHTSLLQATVAPSLFPYGADITPSPLMRAHYLTPTLWPHHGAHGAMMMCPTSVTTPGVALNQVLPSRKFGTSTATRCSKS